MRYCNAHLNFWKKLYKWSWILLIIFIILAAGYRYQLNKKNVVIDDYRDAFEYVNNVNRERSLVLFPFHQSETFLLYSKNPGFFSVNYLVLFIDLYINDSKLQEKAYLKFKALEKKFDINTLPQLKIGPHVYNQSWEQAWREKVDYKFIEQWSHVSDIGYIIREKELPLLPYRQVYENKKYRVYKRK